MRKVGVALVLVIVLCTPFSHALFSYDANGNLVSGDGYYREYNSLNQLSVVRLDNSTGVILETYIYHPLEERVLIKNISNPDGSWKETIYYLFDEYLEIENSSGVYGFTYIFHEGQKVGEIRPDNITRYYHPDHLGSITLITDENGNMLEQTSHTPYGFLHSGGSVSRYGYEGKETSDHGEADFHFRHYKSEWGKFTQPDSIIPNIYDPQQLNRYAFERNNPYKYVDPTGHASIDSPFGPDIHQGVENFNMRWNDFSSDMAGLAKDMWQSIPLSKYIGNALETSTIGAAVDGVKLVNVETKRAIFGESFVSHEELKRKRVQFALSAAEEKLDAELGVTTGGAYTIGNLVYGTLTGSSLATDAIMLSGNAFSFFANLGPEPVSYTNRYGRKTMLCPGCSVIQDNPSKESDFTLPDQCKGEGCPSS